MAPTSGQVAELHDQLIKAMTCDEITIELAPKLRDLANKSQKLLSQKQPPPPQPPPSQGLLVNGHQQTKGVPDTLAALEQLLGEAKDRLSSVKDRAFEADVLVQIRRLR